LLKSQYIKFNINFACNTAQIYNFLGARYIIKEQQHTEFHKNVTQLISKNFQIENNEGNTEEIGEKLNLRMLGKNDIGVSIEKLDETIQSTRKNTFKYLKSPNTTAKGKTVP